MSRAALGLVCLTALLAATTAELSVFDTVQWTLPSSIRPPAGVNPFNYSQFSVVAEFVPIGSGQQINVPAFWTQNFTRSESNGAEVLTPVGEPHYAVRFYAIVPADFTATLRLYFANGSSVRVPDVALNFSVHDASVDARRGSLMAYGPLFRSEGGRLWHFVGENMCWCADERQTYAYDSWLASLVKAGGNYVRLWTDIGGAWTFAVEPQHLGTYSLEALWRLDYVTQMARELYVHVMLELMSYNNFNANTKEDAGVWAQSPYNVANGGPLLSPQAFFANAHARASFGNKLTYMSARYGQMDNVHFEFFNEVDLVLPYSQSEHQSWLSFALAAAQMSWPPKMLTTSFSQPAGDPLADAHEWLSYTQTHDYEFLDEAQSLPPYVQAKLNAYQKPSLIAEYGIPFGSNSHQVDPAGLYLHNGAWAAGIMSGAAGTPMTWWWDSYVDPYSLYSVWTGYATFVGNLLTNYAHLLSSSIEAWRNVEFAGANCTPAPCAAAEQQLLDSYLRVLGQVINGSIAFVWLQNTNHTWSNMAPPNPGLLTPFSAFEFGIGQLQRGAFDVRVVDTTSGQTLSSSTVHSNGYDPITVALGAGLKTDCALLIVPSGQ